jgi:hypothetical protein
VATASADGAGAHPPSAGSLPPSQQAAADAAYHSFLKALTPEQMDFVRNDDRWPVIRTSANKMAIKYGEARKKGDWSAQRSRFIKEVFLTMYEDSESDKDTLLDLMFNGGKYDWLKDTARVIRAVQARYNGKTREKAFTALFQLCEVKCGDYLAESCFDEEYKIAKMVYIDMKKKPDKLDLSQMDNNSLMVLGYIGIYMVVSFFSLSAVVRALKQKAYAALDTEEYGKAQQFMRSAKILESQGFVDTDKERPPPMLEDITDLCDSHSLDGDDGTANDVLDDDGEILASLEALETDDDGAANDVLDEILGSESDILGSESEGEDTLEAAGEQEEYMLQDNESFASTLTLPSSSDDDEPPTDGLACDYSAGCPSKPYAGRDPTPDERRDWETAATVYYQFLLGKYQETIETLRLDVLEFLSQDNLDISRFLNKKNAPAKKFGVTKGLEQVQGYFCLATLYGDVGGTYEPQRLDWYRAQFTTSLPDGWELDDDGKLPENNPLPKRCMFVLVTQEQVMMVLRGGNKNEQDVDQDLTAEAPELAAMLCLWMPHAASAQQDEANPFVSFKITDIDRVSKSSNYGECFGDNSYTALVKRAWVNKKGMPKLGGVNPHVDALKEWEATDRHGFGCGWARTVTGRARRGVVDKDGEQRDDAAAVAQGHSANTERAAYRAM